MKAKKERKESHRERVDLDNFIKKRSSQGKSGKLKKNHKEGIRSDRKKQSHMEKMESEE